MAMYQVLDARQREIDDLFLLIGNVKGADAQRLSASYARAVKTLGDSLRAAAWLIMSSNYSLGRRRPIDVVLNGEEGAELVDYVLAQIESGGPA